MTPQDIQTTSLDKGTFDTVLNTGGNGGIFFRLVTDVEEKVFALTFPGINGENVQGNEILDDTIIIDNEAIARTFYAYATARTASSPIDLYEKTLKRLTEYLQNVERIDEKDDKITE